MQLVIVDRDTLLEAGGDDAPEFAWETVPGSLEALARLSGAGYRLVITCNQSDLRRRGFSIENLNALHHRLQQELLEAGGSIDAVFFCSCHPKDDCDCLMPNPGMLLDIGARMRVSLAEVPIIGASAAAVQAARAAGARPILIDADAPASSGAAEADDAERYPDLGAAVDGLLLEAAQP